MQRNESPPRERESRLEDLLAMLSAQMTSAETAGEGQDGQPGEAMQAGQTLPSMDALDEGTQYFPAASILHARNFQDFL